MTVSYAINPAELGNWSWSVSHPSEISATMYAFRDVVVTFGKQPSADMILWYVCGCFANFNLYMRELQGQE